MSTSDPPPTLPTGAMGVSMPPRCVHNSHPDMCPFCKNDDELVANPELEKTEQSPHEFGCPLFEGGANYKRVYGGDTCTCKPEPKREK